MIIDFSNTTPKHKQSQPNQYTLKAVTELSDWPPVQPSNIQ